jgi:hypothetical protein
MDKIHPTVKEPARVMCVCIYICIYIGGSIPKSHFCVNPSKSWSIFFTITILSYMYILHFHIQRCWKCANQLKISTLMFFTNSVLFPIYYTWESKMNVLYGGYVCQYECLNHLTDFLIILYGRLSLKLSGSSNCQPCWSIIKLSLHKTINEICHVSHELITNLHFIIPVFK